MFDLLYVSPQHHLGAQITFYYTFAVEKTPWTIDPKARLVVAFYDDFILSSLFVARRYLMFAPFDFPAVVE